MHTDGRINKFIRNVTVAFIAQGFSLASSVLISFFVPKILGVAQFGYWQLFLFYSSFSGLFIFGVLEGIYLYYGGVNYEDLEFEKISSQFWVVTILQIVMASIILLLSALYVGDYNRLFILIGVSVSIILTNINSFFGYVFQASNETQLYSVAIIINKAVFLLFIAVLLFKRDGNYQHYILLYLFSIVFSIVFSCINGKKIFFPPFLKLHDTFKCLFQNISIGFSLLVSNLAGMLIIGIGRFIIDGLWGIEIFSKISFSISLANFFLLFIGQISMVLFPTIRQIDREQQRKVYILSRDILGIFLSFIFALYIPIKYILSFWLPQYKDSLVYLAVLLPVCTFDGKMQMLYSTYMKVLRKERIMLAINILTLSISTVLCLIAGFLLHSIYGVLLSISAAIVIRSIVSDIYLAKTMEIRVKKSLITEVTMAIVFVFCALKLNSFMAFIIYLGVYGLYLYKNKQKVNIAIHTIKSLIH